MQTVMLRACLKAHMEATMANGQSNSIAVLPLAQVATNIRSAR